MIDPLRIIFKNVWCVDYRTIIVKDFGPKKDFRKSIPPHNFSIVPTNYVYQYTLLFKKKKKKLCNDSGQLIN